MRKYWSSILMLMIVSVIFTACNNRSDNADIEITEMQEETEIQEESVKVEMSFPGGVLEEMDPVDEMEETDSNSNTEKTEENKENLGDESEGVNSKEMEDVDSEKETTNKEDLLELPVENTEQSYAGVLGL